jgi:hypothetical protein
MSWAGNAIRTKWGDLVMAYNNVISGYNYGLVVSSDAASVDFRNNVVLNSAVHHVNIPGSISSLVQDYNLYYPDGATMFKSGSGFYDLAGYSTARGGIEAQSLSADPGLDVRFRPANSESAVVNRGTDLGEDYIWSGEWPVEAGGATLVRMSDRATPEIGVFALEERQVERPTNLRIIE